jgi:hypothetical protein
MNANCFLAVASNNLVELQQAIAGLNVNRVCRNDNGMTLLTLAIELRNTDCVRFLVQSCGANVDVPASIGATPLHFAVWANEEAILRVLLDAGAKVDVVDTLFCTPLYWAIRYEYRSLAMLLLDRGARLSAIKFDWIVKCVPQYVQQYLATRDACRQVAVIITGVRVPHFDKYLMQLIGKHVWALRQVLSTYSMV